MGENTLLHAGILLFGVFIGAVSQVMLKKAAQKHYDSVLHEYLNPLVILAYALFVGTTLLSVLAYRGCRSRWGRCWRPPATSTSPFLG